MLDVNNVLPTPYKDRKMKILPSMTSTSIEKYGRKKKVNISKQNVR